MDEKGSDYSGIIPVGRLPVQFENKLFGLALPDAGYFCQQHGVPGFNRLDEVRDGYARKNRKGHGRTDAAYVKEKGEYLFLFLGEKSVEPELVFLVQREYLQGCPCRCS